MSCTSTPLKRSQRVRRIKRKTASVPSVEQKGIVQDPKQNFESPPTDRSKPPSVTQFPQDAAARELVAEIAQYGFSRLLRRR